MALDSIKSNGSKRGGFRGVARDAVAAMGDTATEAAHSYSDTTRRAARRMGNHANVAAHATMDEASKSFRNAVDEAQALGQRALGATTSSLGSTVTRFENLVARNPVLALTAALGIGIILGASARK